MVDPDHPLAGGAANAKGQRSSTARSTLPPMLPARTPIRLSAKRKVRNTHFRTVNLMVDASTTLKQSTGAGFAVLMRLDFALSAGPAVSG